MDLILSFLKEILPQTRRKKLRVIIISTTLETSSFTRREDLGIVSQSSTKEGKLAQCCGV
jgi:HrpA-like RNA helicase